MRPQGRKDGAQPAPGQSCAPSAIRMQEMLPSSALALGPVASGNEPQAPACSGSRSPLVLVHPKQAHAPNL